MLGLLCVVIGVYLKITHALGSCQDVDPNACVLLQKSKPDLCSDDAMSNNYCRRFCGNCPLECYHCSVPVTDPSECRTTKLCPNNQTCSIKHLKSHDGNEKYILNCESLDICDGSSLGFKVSNAFGKRARMTDTDNNGDVMVHELFNREASVTCCEQDLCNMPVSTSSVSPASSATATRSAPTTSAVVTTSTVLLEPCIDTVHNCALYGRAACESEVYRPWAAVHCSRFCGFCTPGILS